MTNPLETILNAIEKGNKYEQPKLTRPNAHYLMRALDVLRVWTRRDESLNHFYDVDQHRQLDAMMCDIIMYSPEESDGKAKE